MSLRAALQNDSLQVGIDLASGVQLSINGANLKCRLLPRMSKRPPQCQSMPDGLLIGDFDSELGLLWRLKLALEPQSLSVQASLCAYNPNPYPLEYGFELQTPDNVVVSMPAPGMNGSRFVNPSVRRIDPHRCDEAGFSICLVDGLKPDSRRIADPHLVAQILDGRTILHPMRFLPSALLILDDRQERLSLHPEQPIEADKEISEIELYDMEGSRLAFMDLRPPDPPIAGERLTKIQADYSPPSPAALSEAELHLATRSWANLHLAAIAAKRGDWPMVAKRAHEAILHNGGAARAYIVYAAAQRQLRSQEGREEAMAAAWALAPFDPMHRAETFLGMDSDDESIVKPLFDHPSAMESAVGGYVDAGMLEDAARLCTVLAHHNARLRHQLAWLYSLQPAWAAGSAEQHNLAQRGDLGSDMPGHWSAAEGLKQAASDWQAQTLLGVRLLSLDQPEQAVTLLQKAAGLPNAGPRAWTALANALRACGRNSEAAKIEARRKEDI